MMLSNAIVYEVSVRNYSQEGTIKKVTEDLQRISDLGMDILYLLPIHPISETNRKGKDGSHYALKDYRSIHKELGSIEDLQELIKEAHQLGLKVIMDVAFHHTGRDAVLVQEHPEWYLQDENGNVSLKFPDWSDIYDLDFSHRELWDYLIDSLQLWVDLDVDGFRCDVAAMIPIEFWVEAKKRLDSRLIWIGQSIFPVFIAFLRDLGYTAHADNELYQAFDMTYDDDGIEFLGNYRNGQKDISDYVDFLFYQEIYAPQNAIKLRFLENHDTPRIAEIVSSPSGLRNWTALNFFLPGASLIYAGQEIKDHKQSSLFDKDGVEWQQADLAFENDFKQILTLSKKIKRTCSHHKIQELNRGVLQITWENEQKKFLIILNLEDRFGTLNVTSPLEGMDMLTNKPVKLDASSRIAKDPMIIEVNKK